MQHYMVYFYKVSWEILIPPLWYSLAKKIFVVSVSSCKMCVMKDTTLYKIMKHFKWELSLKYSTI